jgi:Arc/MetJ family transcription regulator
MPSFTSRNDCIGKRPTFSVGIAISAYLAEFFASFSASNDAIIGDNGDSMRTTVTLDDDLLAKAVKLTGGLDRSTVLREGLKALIERESAARLAKLGGTQPQLEPVPRRRAAAT